MQGRTVQLRVGGQTYRVVTSASEDELRRLAAVVDQKLAAVVPPGRAVTPQAMLLAAMALAHDLEEAQAHRAAFTAKARGAFGRLIERVDAALEDGSARPAAEALPMGALPPGPQALPMGAPPPNPRAEAPKALRHLNDAGPAGHPANES